MKNLTDTSFLGTILGIWAHPDDESFGTAGLMCMAAKSGQTVACITATRGEKGVQDAVRWPAERLGDIRAVELEAALDCIGIENHHWLDYIDGELHAADTDTAVGRLKEIILHYQPDTILTFPPDGITGHPDHRAISAWTRAAAEQSGLPTAIYYAVDSQETYERYTKAADERFDIYFNVDTPVVVSEQDCDLVLKLPQEILDCKISCLKSMPSQTEAMFKSMGDEWVRGMLASETFVRSDRTDISWN